MPLSPGTRLGPYEIVAPLGAGGMGEVYRARDTKLDREVAIKVLPEPFVADPERVARFQREAKTLAALNHPHIGGIYGLEDADGVRALVLELVEGPTLADRIAQGPIPLDEALLIAKQIADALEAAHESGIIHRDLKPANIKLRPDGTVKVLDFGLAKANNPVAGVGASATMSPTITTPAMTAMGIILGTAAYMSPEQAKGRPADKRSDVWAFGCLLYEMLTGKRAFEGEDVSDTLAAVLRGEPDWAAVPDNVSPSIALIVRRCLERDRRKRIGDVSTIRFLLDEPLQTAAVAARSRPERWKVVSGMAAVAVVAAVLGASLPWRARPRVGPPIVTKFTIALGEGQQFTNESSQFLTLSPDGTRIAYVSNRRLYLRSMWDLEAHPIRGTEVNPRRPMFSPDSSSIAYFATDERTLKRIAVSGGAPVTVTATDNQFPTTSATWTGEHILFAAGPRISRVPAGGGKVEVLITLDTDEYADAPQMLPDGEHLMFTLARGRDPDRWAKAKIVAQSLKTTERTVLVDGGGDGRFLKTGHLLYELGGVVYALRFEPATLQVIGGPVPILEGVRRTINPGLTSGAAQYSVSDNGSLIYIQGPVTSSYRLATLCWLDQKGGVEPLKLQAGAYIDPRIAPDGKQIAFATDDGKEANIWVYELSGTRAARRLTLGGNNRYPTWSADGRRIAFQSDRESDAAIFWQQADGTGSVERLTKPEKDTQHVPDSFSPDGKVLLMDASKSSNVSLMTLSLEDRKAAPFGDVHSTQPTNAAFSPDGKWVAYAKRTTAAVAQVYVQPFPPNGQPYQITKGDAANAHHPFWSRDGRDLFYIPGATQFAVVHITTRPTFSFSDAVPLSRGPLGFFEGGPTYNRQNDAAADGRVLAVVPGDLRQASMIGVSGVSVAPPIQVVLNWSEELKQRVPTR